MPQCYGAVHESRHEMYSPAVCHHEAPRWPFLGRDPHDSGFQDEMGAQKASVSAYVPYTLKLSLHVDTFRIDYIY